MALSSNLNTRAVSLHRRLVWYHLKALTELRRGTQIQSDRAKYCAWLALECQPSNVILAYQAANRKSNPSGDTPWQLDLRVIIFQQDIQYMCSFSVSLVPQLISSKSASLSILLPQQGANNWSSFQIYCSLLSTAKAKVQIKIVKTHHPQSSSHLLLSLKGVLSLSIPSSSHCWYNIDSFKFLLKTQLFNEIFAA